MSATTEATTEHRAVLEHRNAVNPDRERRGDAAAVRRPVAQVDQLDRDTADADRHPPTSGAGRGGTVAAPAEARFLDGTTLDPAMWESTNDEGLGGYHR